MIELFAPIIPRRKGSPVFGKAGVLNRSEQEREKRRKWDRARYQRDKAKRTALSTKWRIANLDKHNEKSRRWRRNNPQKAAASARNWELRNPEKVAAIRRRSADAHREQRNAAKRAAYQLNKAHEQAKGRDRMRRLREKRTEAT